MKSKLDIFKESKIQDIIRRFKWKDIDVVMYEPTLELLKDKLYTRNLFFRDYYKKQLNILGCFLLT